METETKVRTASEVLIGLEKKMDQLMHLLRSLDLNNKIISNKLNQLLQEPKTSQASEDFSEYNPATEALAPPSFQGGNFPMKIQDQLSPKEAAGTVEMEPVGVARTRRGETYSLAPGQKSIPTPNIKQPEMKAARNVRPKTTGAVSTIPIQQRVVDANGRSIFMANVEIINADSNVSIQKTKTNGMGKWQASLESGKYRVIISKYESLTKQQLETTQHISIDETTSNELSMVILK